MSRYEYVMYVLVMFQRLSVRSVVRLLFELLPSDQLRYTVFYEGSNLLVGQ